MAAEAAACPPPLVVARVRTGELRAEEAVAGAAAGAAASAAAACTPPRVVQRGTTGELRALAAVLAVVAAVAAAAAACPPPRVVARVTKGELTALAAVAAAAVAFPPPQVVVRVTTVELMALAAVAAEAAGRSKYFIQIRGPNSYKKVRPSFLYRQNFFPVIVICCSSLSFCHSDLMTIRHFLQFHEVVSVVSASEVRHSCCLFMPLFLYCLYAPNS